MTALSLSSYRAIRVRYCSTISREVARPCSIAARSSGMVAPTTVKGGAAGAGWLGATRTSRRATAGFTTQFHHGPPGAHKQNLPHHVFACFSFE